jgi:hypothetical protein
VLRGIFGNKRQEIAGGGRKLHNEEFHNLFSPSNIMRVMKSRRKRWARYVARMEETNIYIYIYIQNLIGKPEGKRPFRRYWC